MRLPTNSRAVLGLAVFVAGLAAVVAASQRAASAAAMTMAAGRFLEGLTPELRQQASFPMESDERLRWNFIPMNTFPRNGVPLKSMSEPQRELALNMLRAALSQRGYLTATAIIELETVLKAIESANARGGREA